MLNENKRVSLPDVPCLLSCRPSSLGFGFKMPTVIFLFDSWSELQQLFHLSVLKIDYSNWALKGFYRINHVCSNQFVPDHCSVPDCSVALKLNALKAMFSEDVGGDGIGLQHCIPLVIFKLSNFNGLALFFDSSLFGHGLSSWQQANICRPG